MSRFEIKIVTEHMTRKEVNALMGLLGRAGYATYLGYDKSVCFAAEEGDSVTKIKGKWVNDD